MIEPATERALRDTTVDAEVPPAQSPPVPVGAPLELRDIHPPAPPDFWPPAPGWWLVAALLLAMLLVIGRAGWRAWGRWRRQRVILAELARLRAKHAASPALAAAVSALLKRVALTRYPRTEVAALTGEAWLRFLDRTGGDGRFTAGPGRVLAEAPYAPEATTIDAPALMAAARAWVWRNR